MPTSPTHIQEMLTGFWVSKALFTGVELGVFDERVRVKPNKQDKR